MAFSTSSAAYFLSQNLSNAFSTSSAIYFVNASTTIPKTYTANTFTNTNTFTNAPSSLHLPPAALAVDANGNVYKAATTTAGTGLSYSGNAFNVNTTQNITTLSNLSSGLVGSNSGALYNTLLRPSLPRRTLALQSDLGLGGNTSALTLTGGTNGQVLSWLSGTPTWTASSSVAAGTGISISANGPVTTVTNTGVLASALQAKHRTAPSPSPQARHHSMV